MEPEEIDKLFRDKLAGRPALPAADAWMRLQQKMEPPRKQKSRWVYYAAASAVLLLITGLLFFQKGLEAPGTQVAVAPGTVPPAHKPLETPPASKPHAKPQPEPALAQTPAKARPEPSPGQASASAPRTAGLSRTSPAKPRRLPPARQQPAPDLVIASQPVPIQSPAPQTTLQPQPMPAGQQTLASPTPDLSVVEVVVQRDADAGPMEDLDLREQLSRKSQLLKNIYKQARNLKNGEPVELAAIGVDKDRIQEETKELKQKLTNVISL